VRLQISILFHHPLDLLGKKAAPACPYRKNTKQQDCRKLLHFEPDM
jgi:hypothetical protein